MTIASEGLTPLEHSGKKKCSFSFHARWSGVSLRSGREAQGGSVGRRRALTGLILDEGSAISLSSSQLHPSCIVDAVALSV